MHKDSSEEAMKLYEAILSGQQKASEVPSIEHKADALSTQMNETRDEDASAALETKPLSKALNSIQPR